jgi:hypothetical protein
MPVFIEQREVHRLKSLVSKWVSDCGLDDVNTAGFILSRTHRELTELSESISNVEKANQSSPHNKREINQDVAVLEEFPDPILYLLQLLSVDEIPRLTHAIHQLMFRDIDLETVFAFNEIVQQRRPDESRFRISLINLLASVFAFAIQQEVDILGVTDIKRDYNAVRYPPALMRRIGPVECKKLEAKRDLKTRILYPRLEQLVA